MAEVLNKQYSSVFTEGDTSSTPHMDDSPYPNMPHIKVTTKGVKSLLQKLNPKKAIGPDLVPTRILKDYADDITTPILQLIYQQSLDTGVVPDDWKMAKMLLQSLRKVTGR